VKIRGCTLKPKIFWTLSTLHVNTTCSVFLMATPDPIRDQPFERALPNSAEAERAILGAILLDNG
jgi:hypothetical protein